MPRGRAAAALCAATVTALAAAGAATADREQVRTTAAGQAAARAAVLTRADMGPLSGWTGGTRKPSPPSSPPCTTFQPKQSDLVRIGAARSSWKRPGLEFDSEAQVLQTPKMVRLDWQRTVLAREVLPCMRTAVAKGLTATERLVSARWLSVPRLAAYTRALRVVIDVTTASGTVPVMVDTLLVGRGQTEITLTTTAPYSAAASVQAAELRLGRLLASRIRM